MNTQTTEQLIAKRCAACEGGVEKLTPREAQAQLKALSGWQLTDDARRLKKHWQVGNFLAGIDFFGKVAQLAEREGHHPDLHLEGYRHIRIEISTHAIGGLSENDFILAAKIDRLPVSLKQVAVSGGP